MKALNLRGRASEIREAHPTLGDLQEAVHQNAKNKGWWDSRTEGVPSEELVEKILDADDRDSIQYILDSIRKEKSPGDMFALFHGEISEALEEIRDHRPITEIRIEDNGKPEGVPIELADCVIRILDFCERHGIDLEEAVTLKMAFNETRPYRHGNKAL